MRWYWAVILCVLVGTFLLCLMGWVYWQVMAR